MRIKVITESDDVFLRDHGDPWTIGPDRKADVNSDVRCLLRFTSNGWVVTPLHAAVINGQKVAANDAVLLKTTTEVKALGSKVVLKPL